MSAKAYIVIDAETTANGGPDENSPEAHFPVNKPLLWGYGGYSNKHGEYGTSVVHNTKDLLLLLEEIRASHDEVTLVFQNAKFDLKYLLRFGGHHCLDRFKIHCTMVQEYLWSGQSERFPSMEYLCDKYKIPMRKTMDLGAYLDGGGKMEDIDASDLITYLKQDVDITEEIYLHQHANHNTKYQMNYLIPLAVMELNGLPLNHKRLKEDAEASYLVCDEFTNWCKDYIMENAEWADGTPITEKDFEKKIKPTANRTLSWMLTDIPFVVKTTSEKWTFQRKHEGAAPPLVISKTEREAIWDHEPNHLGYSMSDEYIEKLREAYPTAYLPKHITTWRKHDKLLNTYHIPFMKKAEDTGRVHPKLNPAVTATGRLSSSDPNGQNMPEEIRQLVEDNTGKNICEIDFAQLELVALAMISQCRKLKADINSGEDIHFNSGQDVMGWRTRDDMDEKDRKKVKGVNFGAVYGGRPFGLSKQTGFSQNKVKDLIASLYAKYPGIADWQAQFFEHVIDHMQPGGHKNGEQIYCSTVDCLSDNGRRFKFTEMKAPSFIRKKTGRGYAFSPNQIYNYPIQGFAGWNIVLQFLWSLWLMAPRSWSFIMTVHDSIVLVVPTSTDEREVKIVFNTALEHFLANSPFTFDVALNCDVSIGKTWS